MKKQVDKVNQSPTADAVFEALHSVMHLYRSARTQAFRDEEQDVTHMETRVIAYFDHHPGATLSDLVQHSGRDKAQLTRLIRGLREKAYLEATEDAQDRRSTRLHLTAAGKALQRQLKKSAHTVLEQAVSGMSEQQRGELVSLLTLLQENLEQQR